MKKPLLAILGMATALCGGHSVTVSEPAPAAPPPVPIRRKRKARQRTGPETDMYRGYILRRRAGLNQQQKRRQNRQFNAAGMRRAFSKGFKHRAA